MPVEPRETPSIVDTSCFVGAWPFRLMPLADHEALRGRLRANGIGTALVSPLDAVLQRTPRATNLEWGARLAGDDLFQFVPVANPSQAGAEEVFDDWPDARAVRILPGPHGFTPEDAAGLVAAAGERDRTVIVQWRVIDARMAHPDVAHREPTVDQLKVLASSCPRTRIVVAGARMAEITPLLAEQRDNLWFEISNVEAPNAVRRMINSGGGERLLCGTQAPVHVIEALGAKLAAADLTMEEAAAIAHRNAAAAGLLDD